MLPFLAAFIPIVGSLYAAGSFLIEQAGLAHERRVRERIAPRVAAVLERENVRARAKEIKWDEPVRIAGEYETYLLALNGIGYRGPTWNEHAIDLAMTAPLMSRAERRRQWVLLLTAIAGVVLLAFSAM